MEWSAVRDSSPHHNTGSSRMTELIDAVLLELFPLLLAHMLMAICDWDIELRFIREENPSLLLEGLSLSWLCPLESILRIALDDRAMEWSACSPLLRRHPQTVQLLTEQLCMWAYFCCCIDVGSVEMMLELLNPDMYTNPGYKSSLLVIQNMANHLQHHEDGTWLTDRKLCIGVY